MTLPPDRKRSSSVSYSRGKEDAEDGGDEIHISLAPYIQTYLAHSGQGSGCCGISLPVPFERASPRSWWNPKFDSEILEEQYKRSAFPQIRLRFRYALTYILLVSLSWLAYFVIVGMENETSSWPAIAIIFSTVGASMSFALYLTYTDYYRSYVLPTSLGVASMLCLLSLLFLVLVPPHSDGLTLVGHFALCSEILLLIYTVVPMPLYACVGICTTYSVLFEVLTAYLYNRSSSDDAYSNGQSAIEAIARNTDDSTITETILRKRESQNFTSSKTGEIFEFGKSKLLASLGTAVSTMSESLTGTSVPSIVNSSSSNSSSPSTVLFDFARESPLTGSLTRDDRYFEEVDFSTTLTIRILMQICIHIIGVHILIMTFVRMRGTFMKVGQSLLVRRQLEMEKQLKEKMIHSVMPPKVADWLMEESEREREREDSLKKGSIPSNHTDIRSLFRPFNMHSMDDVSILFADIVGFTRMSSNKTAEELVGILNDLFERFDDLCEHHGCEKISTLGDCYYCVSGCPEPRSDHAKCCVEMGLAMIEAIKQFDIERREGVNMRVGVHTGTVLCGIVGTKRFKFDVWSNDVTLANKLESTGKPGRVHLSERTINFLGDEYLTEEGDTINGVKTYFIKGRKSDLVTEFINTVDTPTSISPLMQSRHRLASCNTQFKPRHHYLHMVTNSNSYRMKANSLPSILDSENDEEAAEKKDDNSKSPTSTASYGKKRLRSKPWRYLQRQRTAEEMTPLEMDNGKGIAAIQEAKLETPPETCEDSCNGLNGIPVSNGIEMDPNPMPSSPLLCGQEPLSHASSICSRKDSGIRSNSRRSSIQQQLFLMNGMAQGDLLGHRVSGYYTSSSTLNSTQEPSSSVPPYPFPPAVTDTFGACFHKLRKQSDLQLIRCVQDNVSSQRSYFVKPPLSSVTLFFKNKEMEKEYRENAHKASEGMGGNPPTLATSRFNTYFDILVSALVYSAITASLFLLCEPTPYFIAFCAVATAIQAFVVILCVRQLLNPNSIHATFTQNIFKFFSRWYPWHACGAVLVGLPIISILMNFSCNSFRSSLNHFEYYYSYLIFVGLVHFCNFTQLNCWMKNLLVTLTGVIFICLVASHVSHHGGGSFEIAEPAANNGLVIHDAASETFDDPAAPSRRFRREVDDGILTMPENLRDYIEPRMSAAPTASRVTFGEIDYRISKPWSKKNLHRRFGPVDGPISLRPVNLRDYFEALISTAPTISGPSFGDVDDTASKPRSKKTLHRRYEAMLHDRIAAAKIRPLYRNEIEEFEDSTGRKSRRDVDGSRPPPEHSEIPGKSTAPVETLEGTSSEDRTEKTSPASEEIRPQRYNGRFYEAPISLIPENLRDYFEPRISTAPTASKPRSKKNLHRRYELLHDRTANSRPVYPVYRNDISDEFVNFVGRKSRRDTDSLPPPAPAPARDDLEPNTPANAPPNVPVPPRPSEIPSKSTTTPKTPTTLSDEDRTEGTSPDDREEKTSPGGQESRPRRYNERLYDTEIFLDMILLLLLVWFLNREFEISYRLSFHGNAVAARDKTRVQSMKNQADWLLHNIIPKYVADQLKTTAKYSQNHKSVGIIFASIVNFNELYDESYLGGKEYLRVLNELIGDFDEILEKPEFANVEKIKTIGSSFMAASGLNPQVRQQSEEEYSHLYQLLDFAVAMHKVIYDFNRDLLGFKLTLRVGYNYGDVTAGVIGATKLYYDIWGDAVNIASRMDSTGVAGRIQLASNCLDVLSERYDFEPRGQVYVKGKDNMNVFLLIGKKGSPPFEATGM